MGTPRDVLKTIESSVRKALKTDELRERLAQQGADVTPETGADYAKLVAEETVRWSHIVQAADVPVQ